MPLSTFQPNQYDVQLAAKSEHIKSLFAPYYNGELAVFASQPEHFRMRAEFRLWHEGEDLYYVMFRQDDPKTPCRIDHFPVACEAINQVMPRLIDALKPSEILRRKLFQVEFLATTGGEVLVSLIYHKRLDDAWKTTAEQLQTQLGVHIIGRARKQRVVLTRDYVMEELPVNSRLYRYQQVEASFTQPNAGVCTQMLQWVCRQAGSHPNSDLLELYCGNGNFTLPLAAHYRRVLATEISKVSVRSALFNADLNDVNNLQIIRMSSEELSSAMAGEREYRRLENIDLDSYQLDTLFVDPPRAGLDDGTLALARGFKKIIYISCNPDTLRNNIEGLKDTHQVESLALFDQFPYTHHAECGAILTAR